MESGVACCASVQSSRKSHRVIWIFTSLLTFLELRSSCCVGRTFCPWGVASLPTASREVCSNRKPSRRTGQSSGPGGLSSSSCPTQPIFSVSCVDSCCLRENALILLAARTSVWASAAAQCNNHCAHDHQPHGEFTKASRSSQF